MAKNKYSYRNTGSVRKPLIIISSLILAALGITIGVIAFNTAEANKIAALKYEFNQFYPDTYDTAEPIDPNTDYDKDGLINSDEMTLNTSGTLTDTDSDGIIDGMEKNYSTDPVSKDSDFDGLPDGVEVLAGLDPLGSSTDGNVNDYEKKFTTTINFNEGKATLSGDANIFGATAEKLTLNSVSSNAGAVTLPYEIYCSTPFESGTISFNYNSALYNALELDADSLKIFRFDPYTKKYTALDSVADTENGCISAEITENGVYVLGADEIIQSAAITEDTNVNIHLLIDNSGSMYPKSILESSEENDVSFKRLSFATNFVTKLNDKAKVAISAFTYEFKPMCEFETKKDIVVSSINKIRTLGPGFDGTSVERALMLGLESFTPEMKTERNIIILLTDGISTSNAGYTLEKISATAHAKNVTIMTISLGDEYDKELLSSIADHTGGKYFQISEANALENLYSTILATMDDDIIDSDMDGTPDSYTLYDTGFRAEENGFSFENFKSKTNDTLDFGMVMLARDWFRSSVPNSITTEDESTSFTFEGTTIDRSQPLRKVILKSMQSDYLNPETYLNFLSPPGTLKLTKEAEKDSVEMGWMIKTAPYNSTSGSWTETEYLAINHTIGKIRVKYSEDDFQFIRAIHYYETFRNTDNGFVLSSDSDLNSVKKILATGTPLIMKMSWEENGEFLSRYVLLTALRRDVNDPNSLNGKIYDTNHNSQSNITFCRTPRIMGKQKGGYSYSASWNGKQVSVTFYTTEAK